MLDLLLSAHPCWPKQKAGRKPVSPDCKQAALYCPLRSAFGELLRAYHGVKALTAWDSASWKQEFSVSCLISAIETTRKQNLYSFLRIREFFSTFSSSCFLTWPLLPHSLPPQPWLLLRLFTSAAKLVRLFPVRNGAALHVCACWLVSCFIEQFGLCKMVFFNGLPLGLLGRLKRWFWIMCIPPYQSRCSRLEHREKVGQAFGVS